MLNELFSCRCTKGFASASGTSLIRLVISRKGYPRAEGMPVICWRCPSHVQRILTLTFLP